jgi:hypothetical protein
MMMRTHLLRAAAGALLIAVASAAEAQTVTGSSAGGPTFIRRNQAAGNTCSATGTVSTRFSTVSFLTMTGGSYTFVATASGWDPYLFLYAGPFNPSLPSLNCIAADDDSGPGLNSQFTRALTAGTTYTAVVAGFGALDAGAWTLTATGPAALTVVPEAPQVLMLATGMLGVGVVARRRRRV